MASDKPGQPQRCKRTKFNTEQCKILIEAFERNKYPGISIREELARLTQVPEARIQVWFQNRRARIAKKSQRSSHGETAWAQAPVAGPAQSGVFAFDYSGQKDLPRTPRDMGHFSWELEYASGQAVLLGHAGVLDVNVAYSGLETPACMSNEPSGDLCGSLSSSPAVFSPLASRQLFPQLDANGAGTQVFLEAPGPSLPGDWVLHGQEQHHCSEELQPGEAPGYLGPSEQPMLSPTQQFWLHPATFPLLLPQSESAKRPTECQEELPPPSGDLHSALELPAPGQLGSASCCHNTVGNDLYVC